jgi:hypothetical protein
MNTSSVFLNNLYLSFIFSLLLLCSEGFSRADAGPDKTICACSSVELRSDTYDPQNCYYWSALTPPDEIVSGQHSLHAVVNPTTQKFID